ncbi:MAG: hypothetical protein GX781_01085, partial [Clostridiales bacterium]|nr:hypothetical protein [Clostridiales bacterium]
RELAHQNGLPFDPMPLPQPGEGGVYLERTASPLPAIIAITFVITILYVGYQQKNRKKEI